MSRLAVNLALLTGGEFVGKVLVAVVFAYLGRMLGPSSYGQLEFTLALMFFCTILVEAGLTPFGAREIAKDAARAPRLVTHIVLLRGGLAVCAYALLAVVVALIDKPAPLKEFVLLYGLTLFELPALLPYVYQWRDEMQYIAAASIVRWSIFAAGIFALVHGPHQLWGVALAEGVAIAGAALVYFWARPRGLISWRALRHQFDPALAWSIFRGALPIGASEMLWALKFYFATVLLDMLVGGVEVGWFAAALRVVVALHIFVWVYFFNLLPSIARTTQGRPERLQGLMQTSLRITVWTGILIGLAGAVFAAPVIAVLYGRQYEESIATLQALIWIIPLALVSGNYRVTLLGYDRQHLELASALGGAGLNVVLNILLVPRFGRLGAAWSMVLSEAVILLLAYLFVQRTVAPIAIWPHLYRPLAAAAAAAAVLLLFPFGGVWLKGTLALGVYGLGVPILQPRLVRDLHAMLVHRKSSDLVGT